MRRWPAITPRRRRRRALWSPAHAGYFGTRGDSLDDLLRLAAVQAVAGAGIGLVDWLDDLLELTGHG